MMKISMFIPFLLATVSSHSSMMQSRMLRDPKGFVATFQNADPDAINKVIELINGLIEVGLSEKQQAIDDHEASIVVLNDAHAVREAVQADLIFKKGELHIAKLAVAYLTADEAYKTLAENEALDYLNKGKDYLNVEEEHQASEDKRITGERAVLEQVLDILESLSAAPGRRLLSFSPKIFLATLASQGLKVDPEALDSVVQSVNALIAEGERLQAENIHYVEVAKEQVEIFSSQYDAAVKAHVDATQKLAIAVSQEATYQALVDDATEVFNAATDAEVAATDSEASLHAFRISEIERVDGETSDFNEVKDLLKGLL